MAKCGHLKAFVWKPCSPVTTYWNLRVGFRHFKHWFPKKLHRYKTVNTLTTCPSTLNCRATHVWSHYRPPLIPNHLVMTLPDDLAGARPRHIHHYPYISLSISGTVVRIKFQIPRPVPPPLHHTTQLLFPSNERRIHEVVKKHHWHMILQHLCIGLWPWITHRLQPSTLERAKSRGVSRHHLAGEDIPKIGGWFQWHEERTYLLPGPRLPRPKFDVPGNQLIPSC